MGWAKDVNASTRQRARFEENDLIALEIKQSQDKVTAHFRGLVPPEVVRDRRSIAEMVGSAIDDLRTNRVRKAVLKRANGVCEYGSSQSPKNSCITFLKRDGTPYLETHHVIELSEQGKDKESNVIALCANHHREAHFGQSWKALQDEFLEIISAKLGR